MGRSCELTRGTFSLTRLFRQSPMPHLHSITFLLSFPDIANEDKAAEVVQAVEALGRRATFVQCDVRRRSLTDAAVLDAVKKMGVGPDILVASAGGVGGWLWAAGGVRGF